MLCNHSVDCLNACQSCCIIITGIKTRVKSQFKISTSKCLNLEEMSKVCAKFLEIKQF